MHIHRPIAAQQLSKSLKTKFYYKNEQVKKSSEEIFQNFLHSRGNAGEKYGAKKDLTLLDLPYCPEPVEDADLFLLFHTFDGKRSLFCFDNPENPCYPTDISPNGFIKLNEILDMAGKHTRRQGVGKHFFRTTLKDWCEILEHPSDPKKWKVFFHIKDKQEYNNLLKKLTTHQLDTEHYAFNERAGRFLKNMLNFSDIRNNDVYEERRKLFFYVMKEVIGDCFGIEHIPTKNEDESIYGDFAVLTDAMLPCEIDGEKMMIHLMASVKGQSSTINKLDTDRTYRFSKAANDMLRGQIHGENYEQTIKALHHMIDYFYKDPKRRFIKDESLPREGLKIKDKGLIETDEVGYQKILQSLPEGKAKDIILSVLDAAHTKKHITSKDYIDAKLILPIKVGKPFTFELKFVLPNRRETNEKGFSRHEVYKLLSKLENQSRHKKTIFEEEILGGIEETLTKTPVLIDELAKGDRNLAKEMLLQHIYSKLQKVVLPDGKHYYMMHGTYSLYKNRNFLPEHSKEVKTE
ncbi:MAG: hypothetical protein LBG52_08675 [Candidatus Peribacteria bacterium]|jgi:hypothetical protein|nr:hypothetical protein [Candidatus Peribacteria bacterium]